MLTRTCRAPGCGARTTRYGVYCTTHKSRSRRHGHPEQRAITKADLKPYLKLVRKRIDNNADSPLWGQCEARWKAVVDHAQCILAAYQGGQTSYRYERIAAQEVVKLAADVEARKVIETTCALYIMQDDQPRRFRSDDAFRSQLARRVRSLTECNCGFWHDHRTGQMKRAYRDIPPKAVVLFSHWVGQTVGVVGLHLAKLERDEAEARRGHNSAMYEAIAALR